MKNNKAFTLVELLAVIIILAIILVIAIPNIMKIIDKAKIDAYQKNEALMVNAARNYLAANLDKAPLNIGDISVIDLSELQFNNIIGNIKDINSNTMCTGKVIITKNSNTQYTYNPYLECGSNYKTYDYISDGLIVHLDGYDAPVSSVWIDKTGNSNSATMINMLGDGTSGYNATKKAYVFDGINDYMEIAYGLIVNPDNYTISIVAKTNILSTSQMFFGSSTGTNQRLFMGVHSTGKFDSGIQSVTWNGADPSATATLNPTTLTLKLSGGIATLYVNDLATKTRTYTAYVLSSNFGIGKLINSSYYLNGNVYSVRIYNRVLTDAEIINNYNVDKQRFGF